MLRCFGHEKRTVIRRATNFANLNEIKKLGVRILTQQKLLTSHYARYYYINTPAITILFIMIIE